MAKDILKEFWNQCIDRGQLHCFKPLFMTLIQPYKGTVIASGVNTHETKQKVKKEFITLGEIYCEYT